MKRKNDRVVAGAIPITSDNKFVLISNSKGNFIFPKGGVKKNEKNYEAAKREANEEAGIEGEVETEVKCNLKGISFYILHVSLLKDEFDASKQRTRIILAKDEILSNDRVPKYIKSIISDINILN